MFFPPHLWENLHIMTHWSLYNVSSISEELKSGLGCRFCKHTQYVVRLMLILIHYLRHSFCAQKREQNSLFSNGQKKKPKPNLLQWTWLRILTTATDICGTFFHSVPMWKWSLVIYIEPNSGIAAGVLHILIVKTAVTLVTSTPQKGHFRRQTRGAVSPRMVPSARLT